MKGYYKNGNVESKVVNKKIENLNVSPNESNFTEIRAGDALKMVLYHIPKHYEQQKLLLQDYLVNISFLL